jgi:flagellar motor switch protein FliG
MQFGERGVAAYQATQRLGQKTGAEPGGRSTGKNADEPSNTAPVPGHGKAAKLLMLLGTDEASRILRHLREDEIEAIVRELASVRKIGTDEARDILAEFDGLPRSEDAKSGGLETAREMLVAAFGPDEAHVRLRKACPDAFAGPFAFLDELEFHQIMLLLKGESAPVVSLIIPHMDARKAAQVLEALPPSRQREVVKRVSRMHTVNPEVLDRIGGVLKEKIRRQGQVSTQQVDGADTLSHILQYMDPSAEERLISSVQEASPELGDELRRRLFTIGVLFHMADQDVQALLRDFSDQELALVLKGKDPKVRERVLANLSDRRRGYVEVEEAGLGAVPREDAEKATRDFLDYLRDQADEGRWSIRRGGDDTFVG